MSEEMLLLVKVLAATAASVAVFYLSVKFGHLVEWLLKPAPEKPKPPPEEVSGLGQMILDAMMKEEKWETCGDSGVTWPCMCTVILGTLNRFGLISWHSNGKWSSVVDLLTAFDRQTIYARAKAMYEKMIQTRIRLDMTEVKTTPQAPTTPQPTLQVERKQELSGTGRVVVDALHDPLESWSLYGDDGIQWRGQLLITLDEERIRDIYWEMSRGQQPSLLVMLREDEWQAIHPLALDVLKTLISRAVKGRLEFIAAEESHKAAEESRKAVEAEKAKVDELEKKAIEACKDCERSFLSRYPIHTGTTMYTPSGWTTGTIYTMGVDMANGAMTVDEARNVRKNEGEEHK